MSISKFKINYITEFGEDNKNDWADIIVELESGKSYSFTVETIERIRNNMVENKESYFYEEDLIVVDCMSKENIEKAIQSMIDNGVIEKLGLLQV